MALEAVAFPPMKDLFSFGELGDWSCYNYDFSQEEEEDQKKFMNYDGWDIMSQLALPPSSSSVLPTIDTTTTTTENGSGGGVVTEALAATTATAERKKRPRRSTSTRSRSCKNTEEVENQRMTHIAVERNRRRLMNEYLAVLRSIMPSPYVQRGDQASIVGGAINFVKELEQLLQSLDAQRRLKLMSTDQYPAGRSSSSSLSPTPFSDFFVFPQYSSASPRCASGATVSPVAKNRSTAADIEVTMVESHASLKVLARHRPKQLLKMVVGLQNLRLTTLHLNVTTVHQMVLYSFSLKLEDDCHFTSVDDIATAVHHIVGKIQEESGSI